MHHGAALIMAHDCLRNSTTTTLTDLARDIILAQRSEILEIRRMLLNGGLDSPEYYCRNAYFSFTNPPKDEKKLNLPAPAAVQHHSHSN